MMMAKYQMCILMAVLVAVIHHCQGGVPVASLAAPPLSPISSSSSSSSSSSEEAYLQNENLRKYNKNYDSSSTEEDSSEALIHSIRHHGAVAGANLKAANGISASKAYNSGHLFNGRNYNTDYLSSTGHDQSSSKSSNHRHRSSSSSSSRSFSTSSSSGSAAKDFGEFNRPSRVLEHSTIRSSAKDFRNAAAFDAGYRHAKEEAATNYYHGGQSSYNELAKQYNERNEPERFKAFTSSNKLHNGRVSSTSASLHSDYKSNSLATVNANANNYFNRKDSDQYKFDFAQGLDKAERKLLKAQQYNLASGSHGNYKNSEQYHESRGSKSSSSDHYYNKVSSSTKSAEGESRTLSSDMGWKDDGGYEYHYETSNGIKRTEVVYPDGSMQGTTSYISPEGVEIKTSYIADEYGYRAVGDHIPKVPEYIVRSLDYIRTHPYVEKDYYTGEFKTPRTPTLPEHYGRGVHEKRNYEHLSHKY